jgi:glycerol-3-phosphate acyltransferase PlsY
MEECHLTAALWLAGAYLVGSVPFGYLIGRMRGVDVRTVGSKNIGATNVFRTVGKSWGLLAFLCDFLKGLLPTLACRIVCRDCFEWLPVAVGLACVVGHTLTVFMKFKGGKGVATAFGMMVALIPYLALGALALFIVTVWLSHYISLGSCLAAAALGIAVWFCGCPLSLKVVVSLIAVFVIVKHKSNIRRLIDGCENKIY